MTKAIIYYHDIGDYLTREEKLHIIQKFVSAGNPDMPWQILKPNEYGDWISQRNDKFGIFIPLNSEIKNDLKSQTFFVLNSRGNETARDAWVYNSSKKEVKDNMLRMVQFYNKQVDEYHKVKNENINLKVNDFIDTNTKEISWSSSLIPNLERGSSAIFEPDKILFSFYRPFFKQNLYFGDKMIHRGGQMQEFFLTPNSKNFVICISGIGVTKDFSAIITDIIPDLELIGKSQCFPLYYYEERQKQSPTLFDTDEGVSEYIQRDGVSDFILDRAQKQYGKNVTKEDIFYYVYGFLHSHEYREKFSNDLKKMLPRLPLVDDVRDFWAFSKAGRKLADLHINYEKVPPYPELTVKGAELLSFLDAEPAGSGLYRVEKMRFPSKGVKEAIIYNSKITISDIPERAYQYVVNGKSAIEWIMERYAITTHKESGIKNDPNDWSAEVGNPRYILDLLLSIINVSMLTVDIVEGLPKVTFE